ncbi:MAG: FAD-binding oxidoreductase [Synergistaceae bacterium]|jgi:D-lactate dehydrogenase (cytochrome)|nr:FAD-binding oxidoreductase [Synergistaceae bacterium]
MNASANGGRKPVSDQYELYLKDESRFSGKAEEIAFPVDAAQVENALRYMTASKTPLTVQGARTGIAGAATPARGGILSMIKMDSITQLSVDDEDRFYVTVDPGVPLSELTHCLTRKNFDTRGWDAGSKDALARLKRAPAQFFPPDPTETTAALGGLFACNAQGLSAYRYGGMAEHVQSVTLALPDGRSWKIVRGEHLFDANGVTLPDGRRLNVNPIRARPICRCPVPREKMDLLDLIAGSEGMLGIVTNLTLRLAPAPLVRWGILFFFSELSQALAFSQTVVAERGDSASVEAVEFFDRASLDLVEELKTNTTQLRVVPEISSGHQAAVYVQLSARNSDIMEETLLSLLDTFAAHGGNENDAWAAEGEDEMQKFKMFRHAVPEAANARIDDICRNCPGVHKMSTDFTTPLDRLEEAAVMYRSGMEESGVSGAVFGHAAIGRLHVNLFPETLGQVEEAQALIDAWARNAIAMGGRLADENGVGKIKRNLLRYMPEEELQAARAVKNFFDPDGLLNPDNMFPDNMFPDNMFPPGMS